MKIAVISDIHGNMEAIDAVMSDIREKQCDRIFALGDFAMAGPEPDLAIDYFMKRKDNPKYTMIQGNTDWMIANYSEELYNTLKEKAPVMAAALKNDEKIIKPLEKEFLRNLPIQLETEEEGVKFLLVHGSPRKNNEDILPDTPLKEVEKMLENVEANVVLCGHTHIPCGFQTNTKQTVVNVGSIGRTFFINSNQNELPKACYLIINVNSGDCVFEHQFVSYDNERAAQKIINRGFYGADKLAKTLLNPNERHF